jgi:hypothetical protein
MRFSEPGHRAPVAIHAPMSRVAELGSLRMNATNKMNSGALVLLGRVVASALSGTAALVITWLILVVAGIFRVTTILVMTARPYDPVRRSFHIFGHVFEQGDFPFHIFCAMFFLPSVAVAVLVWIHLGHRWKAQAL